ncbi:glycosyl transferase family 2 [Alkalihalobacillus pseudalcaliphilus]|nr:glycosyl transferase family 2 [Alkalihalobacillus pseudalcaliphilus]
MHPKVSIIIPVYNAEKYLTFCINSLFNQQLRECEFIFINDGSTDGSSAILEEFRKFDKRVKLIHQKNKGVSEARNAGLAVAKGDYIGFVDADDYIEADMYKNLYKEVIREQSDAIISNLESQIDGYPVITSYPFPMNKNLDKAYINKHMLPYFIYSEQLNSVCNKLYRAAIIKEQNLTFPKKVALGEDGLFNMQFLEYAQSVRYIDYVGYHYREVVGSATRNSHRVNYFHRALEVFNEELPLFIKLELGEERIKELKSIKLVNSVMSFIHIYFAPSTKTHFSKRYKWIQAMISDRRVRDSLPFYYRRQFKELNSYEKVMFFLVKYRFIYGLYGLTLYSRFRNKK